VFFVNVPVGVIVLIAIPALVARDASVERTPMDAAGAVTITAGLTAAVAALSFAGQLGWASPVTLGLSVLALALLGTFVLIERRAAHPLVPFRFFRNRDAATGNLVMLLAGGATTALFFALSVYLQEVLRYDALTAGISQLPLAGALVVVAGVVPSVVGKLGLRVTVVSALIVFAAGLVWLAAAGAHASFVGGLLGPSILIGVGLGAVFVTATQLAVDGSSASESGLASGLVNTSQQIGGALGLAVLGTIAAARTSASFHAGASAPAALSDGFALLFLAAAALAVLGAGVAVLLRPRR